MEMLLPQGNDYVSGEVSVFDKLVRAGEENACIDLPLRLRSFLIGCLMEYLRDIGMFQECLALNILEHRRATGEVANGQLKRTGDIALILAGLFPRRVRRMNVSLSYVNSMGEGAYMNLADKFLRAGRRERALFYGEVGIQFSLLVEVLNGARSPRTTAWQLYQEFQKKIG